jgi:hypothetical protein
VQRKSADGSRQRCALRENPLVQTLAKCAKSGRFHLEAGGFTIPKRQNNNFLDGALHFVIC